MYINQRIGRIIGLLGFRFPSNFTPFCPLRFMFVSGDLGSSILTRQRPCLFSFIFWKYYPRKILYMRVRILENRLMGLCTLLEKQYILECGGYWVGWWMGAMHFSCKFKHTLVSGMESEVEHRPCILYTS
jgi:hypothetical protein